MFELCNIIRKLQKFMGIVSKHGNSEEAMTSFQGHHPPLILSQQAFSCLLAKKKNNHAYP
jgi:hypothetical protein